MKRSFPSGKLLLSVALLIPLVSGAVDWRDRTPAGSQSAFFDLADGRCLRIDVLRPDLFRVRLRHEDGFWTESGLNRYDILTRDYPAADFVRSAAGVETGAARLSVDPAAGSLRLRSLVSAADVRIGLSQGDSGFSVTWSLGKGERLYGLGDIDRKNVMRRPGRYDVWVNMGNKATGKPRSSFPVPMIVSHEGWGTFVNTTWRNTFDVGEADPDVMSCSTTGGTVDLYLFVGRDYRALLDAYTSLTGRPALLPAFGYGLCYICNRHADENVLMNESLQFRREKLPCDILGLEPGWMSRNYDFTTRKQWNPDKFRFTQWAQVSRHIFGAALQRTGFKLSLWLCCDYDLFRYEEQCAAARARAAGLEPDIPSGITEDWRDDRKIPWYAWLLPFRDPFHHEFDRVEPMPRLGFRKTMEFVRDAEAVGEDNVWKGERSGRDVYHIEDEFDEGDLPWFEHLKKFVDQGAQAFKLDGAMQKFPNPGRDWANGMDDTEAHNLYTAVYAKQMARGYEDYTGLRAMINSGTGYVGHQQFVASWAGDTGGGEGPLVSTLDLAFSGHSNHSSDLDADNVESLHFNFLQGWTQHANWDYWEQPWFQREKDYAAYRKYDELRYRLFPYLYTTASVAARTGYPMVRPLPMACPDDPAYDGVRHAYMLGDAFLVSAFTNAVPIPPGTWYDYRTGEKVAGPCVRPVTVTDDWGGALYVKAGSIVPIWPLKQHLDRGWNDVVELHVWGGGDGEFELYEDDGESLGYRKGAYALTPISCKGRKLTVGPRQGTFAGAPETRRIVVVCHGSQGIRRLPSCDVGSAGGTIDLLKGAQ